MSLLNTPYKIHGKTVKKYFVLSRILNFVMNRRDFERDDVLNVFTEKDVNLILETRLAFVDS